VSTLVRRDQFNITPQGITHRPTDAGFTPYPGDPLAGTMHMGHLDHRLSNEEDYQPEDVKKVMQTLWREYVAQNSALFKK
jgi:hypothetical protein